jgi:hypothetical protein
MTIKGLLGRFGLIYTVALFAGGWLVKTFNIGSTSINIAVLAGTVIGVAGWFVQKNGRDFTRGEKTAAIFGMWAIDMLLQAVVTAAAMSASDKPAGEGTLALAMAVVGVLHLVAIAGFTSLASIQFKKKAA